MNYRRNGCDQQGRYPQAAEAATDVGQDDIPTGIPTEMAALLVAIAVVVFAAVAVAVMA